MKPKILLFVLFIFTHPSLFIINSNVFAQNVKPEIVLQMGHTEIISSIAISKNEKYVLSGSFDESLKLWEINTGKVIRTFNGHSNGVMSVSLSLDGKYALSGGWDKKLKLWDINTGKEIRTFVGHREGIFSIGISPNGNYALSGSYDSTIILWDISSGKVIRTFVGHHGYIYSVNFSPDGNYALSGGCDSTIILWDISSGKMIRTFAGHHGSIYSTSFSPDGKYVLSGSCDSTIKLWDINTGKEIRTFEGHKGIVKTVTFSPDGKYALSGSWDKTLKLWDITTGKEIKKFIGHSAFIESVLFFSTDKYVLSCSRDNTLKLWDSRTGKEIKTFEGHGEGMYSVTFSPEGKYVLFGDWDNSLKLWDLSTNKIIRNFKGHSDFISSIRISSDGKNAISGSWDHTIKLWDLSSGQEIKTFEGHSDWVNSVCFSPNGDFVLSGSSDHALKLWNINTGKDIRTLTGHDILINSVAYSPNSKFAISGNLENTIILWDLSSGQEIKTFEGHSDWVNSVCFSPNGDFVLSGSEDKTLKLWDIHTGKVISTLEGHSGPITSVTFSPDGKYALSGSEDKTLKLWDIIEGILIRSIDGNNISITSVEFSPNGKYAVTGSWGDRLRIWDIWSAQEIVSLITYDENNNIIITPDNFYTCSKGGINAVAFVIGNEVYPPEQFDLQYNRPDIVLERIGLADPEIIKAYREAYYKRLRKMKFDTLQFRQDFHLPELKILNKDFLWGKELSDKNIKLQIDAKDTAYTLDRINVFVNEVPVFGTNGIDLRNRNTHTFTENIPLELSDVNNKIQVSVLNSAGVESLKDFFDVTYKPQEKYIPKTYFIGIGVSNYKDRNFNLNYASKDIYNLDSLYKIHDSKNLVSITLYDEQVTRENILKIRESLQKTNINDLVIVSLSGHGILDKNYNFYYATWNMKFDEPSKYGLIYDDLDKLLDSIPARKKVLFIDACNSGEVDIDLKKSDTLIAQNKKDGKEGDIPDIIDSLQKNSVLGLKNSFDIMQEIFINLTKGNGAVVISAARGYQSAFERESFGNTGGNGAFTACIIEALTEKKSELSDKNGHITISKLKDYVIKRVEEITKGRQKPTTRTENLEYDFVVW